MEILTIRDIARLAHVSVSTVSRVLNGRPDVSARTREAVMQVIRDNNFTQNSNAKNLKQHHSEMISIVVRGRQNWFLTDVAERMIALDNSGRSRFLLDFIDEQEDEFAAAHRQHAERKLKGIVFLGSSTAGREREICSLPLPCVFATVDTRSIQHSGISSVSVDNCESARTAVNHLIENGHREIAVMGGRRHIPDSIGERFQGVLAAFDDHSLTFDEDLYIESHFALDEAYKAAQQFLSLGRKFTALFCMGDTMAIGAMKALAEHGLRVPDDVSIVGFDNIPLAQYMHPTLTTISQPSQLLAEKSMELIDRLISDPNDTENVILPSTLVRGGTVRMLGA